MKGGRPRERPEATGEEDERREEEERDTMEQEEDKEEEGVMEREDVRESEVKPRRKRQDKCFQHRERLQSSQEEKISPPQEGICTDSWQSRPSNTHHNQGDELHPTTDREPPRHQRRRKDQPC